MRTVALLLFALALPALAGPIAHVALKADPPGPRVQIISAQFSPAETQTYDELVFSCRYEQRFVQPNAGGGTTNRIHSPGFPFVHREKSVRMVAGLDHYISFRVPVEIHDLRQRFGRASFVTNAPVVVQSVTIQALTGGKVAWNYTLKPGESMSP